MARDQGLEELILNDLGSLAGITEKAMFGGWAWLLHGNLLCGARDDGMLVRLGKGLDGWALAIPGIVPMEELVKVILLRGQGSSGKTSTLGILYQMLLSNGGTSLKRTNVGAEPNDFEDIVTFQGKTIGVATMGDYSGYVVQKIKSHNASGTDVFVCACNQKFITPVAEAKKYQHHFLTKRTGSLKLADSQANYLDAMDIFALI